MNGDLVTVALVAFCLGAVIGSVGTVLVAVGSIDRHLMALEGERRNAAGQAPGAPRGAA
jgi:hypothetical protein